MALADSPNQDPTPNGRSLRRGRKGLAHALQRCADLLELQQHPDPDSVVIAAAEAATWACALDELWSDARGKGRYWAVRDADPDGAVLLGLRWARNNHLHELIDATDWDYTDGVPIGEFEIDRDPLAGWTVTWAPSSVVTARRVSSGKVHAQAQAAYDEQLAGSPVLDGLRAALRWFDRIGGDQALI